MKIVVITELLWPQGGGSELAVYLLLKRLAEKGLKVMVLTNNDAKPPKHLSEVIKIYRIPFLRKENINKMTLLATIPLLLTKGEVIKLIRSADIIYIPHYLFYVLPIIKMLFRKPIVVHLYDNIMLCPMGSAKPLYSPEMVCRKFCPSLKSMTCLYRYAHYETRLKSSITKVLMYLVAEFGLSFLTYVITLADHVIVETKTQKARVLSRFHSLNGRVTVIPNLLPDIGQTPLLNRQKPTLGYLGGNRVIKGFDIVLKLSKFFKDELTIMANVDPLVPSPPRSLACLGRLPHDRLDSFYSQIWALIFPSKIDEPTPYAVIEAMLRGRPVIARRTDNMIELLCGNIELSGLLYDPIDESDLIEKIRFLISRGYIWIEKLGNSTSEHVLKVMDNARSFTKFIDVIERVARCH